MSIDQPYTPDFATRKEEIMHSLEGVEAAIQSAARMNDQKWLEWIVQRRDKLQKELTKEQA